MQIVDVDKERSEEQERKKRHYYDVVSLADEVFKKERVTIEGRGIVGTNFNSIYVDFNESSRPSRCSVEIGLTSGLEIRVYDEHIYQEARKFGEKVEKRFKERVTLRHNFSFTSD